jgi:hypothetical protein
VVNELSMELIKGALSTDSKIEVDEVNNTLIFKRI